MQTCGGWHEEIGSHLQRQHSCAWRSDVDPQSAIQSGDVDQQKMVYESCGDVDRQKMEYDDLIDCRSENRSDVDQKMGYESCGVDQRMGYDGLTDYRRDVDQRMVYDDLIDYRSDVDQKQGYESCGVDQRLAYDGLTDCRSDVDQRMAYEGQTDYRSGHRSVCCPGQVEQPGSGMHYQSEMHYRYACHWQKQISCHCVTGENQLWPICFQKHHSCGGQTHEGSFCWKCSSCCPKRSS
jgi:hypothetical protein